MQPNEFWERDNCCRDQKFYTTFCLLVAACSDYATGVELQRKNRLNWACTIHYYSLVHAARLICFVKTGDFPTGHSELGELFCQGQLNTRRKLTWIKRKLQPYVLEAEGTQVEPVTNFQLLDLSAAERKEWGQILTKARKLRDDANYEGLLMAHEYSHRKVTECFEQLADTLQEASERLLPDMVTVFKIFIDSSSSRDCWYAFLNWRSGLSSGWSMSDQLSASDQVGEGLYYLEASLRHRRIPERNISRVRSLLSKLYREPDVDVWRAKEVHGNIRLGVFGIKSNLMNDFQGNIEQFKQDVSKIGKRGGLPPL